MSGEQAAQPAGETSMAETSMAETSMAETSIIGDRANQRAEQTPAEQAIPADIERTRGELAETVQELTSKADVVARARQAVGMRRYWAGLAGVAAGLALTAVFIRKLRRR
jgi:Protein of unknown function (DUF3618)